jgi:hypothetical protein
MTAFLDLWSIQNGIFMMDHPMIIHIQFGFIQRYSHKNKHLMKDHPMIIQLQFGFTQMVVWEKYAIHFPIWFYKGNNKITELRTIFQRESQNS